MTKKRTIHCMGIGGSALSGIALAAKKRGYNVSGCDLDASSPYLKKLKRAGVLVRVGHDEKHVNDTDLVIISPAIMYQNPKHPEVQTARNEGKLKLWEEFVGEELIGKSISICVAGTHGKSTTTALVGLILEVAYKDPTVFIGATVNEWNSNYRVGDGKYIVFEADEFYEKFLHYKPQYIILNNIEFDHPDYFDSEESLMESFVRFVKSISGEKQLIVNQDSKGIVTLFERLPKEFLKDVNVTGYTLKDKPLLHLKHSIKGVVVEKTESTTVFKVITKGFEEKFTLQIAGDYNVSNALGVIALGNILKIPLSVTTKVLSEFTGIGRRMEKLSSRAGITVYDDYAHHPTAIKATLSALRQKHPKAQVWAIVEPHSFSRTKALLSDFRGIFAQAGKVVIGPIFQARDTEMFGVTGQSIVDVSEHPSAIYLDDFDKIVKLVKEDAKKGDVLIVMGAGKSHELACQIVKSLKK